MTRPHAPPLTRTAAGIVRGGLLLLALLPPLLWLATGLAIERERVRSVAHAAAWLDANGAGGAPALAGEPIGGVHLARVGVAGAASDGRGWVDWPATVAEAPRAGGGTWRAARSLRPLAIQSLWVALLSGALALAGWHLGMHRTVGLMARAEGRMRALGSLDALTGLLNREGLARRLRRALDRRRTQRFGVGMLLIDIDRFGLVNETLGQASGDELLRAAANRIRAVTRAGDGLARIGGDQFAVHVDTSTGLAALMSMARNLQRAFEAPCQVGGREVVVTISIGVALADQANTEVDELLHWATQALRSAKKQGAGRIAHHDGAAEQGGSLSQRLDLEQRMHGALGAGQFFVVYQPIVDAASERAGMVEALLRWRDPARGVVSPAEFIPALEQTGLIVPVGRWVLHEALRQIAAWPGRGPQGEPLAVSVNLSPLQLAEPDFLDMVTGVLRETGVPAERLQLEVTEGLLLDPAPHTLRKIDELTEMGVKLAVDDFGMGYSSLIYLKRFRLHTLKIDRMFVRDIAERSQDLTIVRAIIDLGHGLGMRVTAEGVETRAQSDALRALGCDTLQGYLYGRPDTAESWCAAPAAPAAHAAHAASIPRLPLETPAAAAASAALAAASARTARADVQAV